MNLPQLQAKETQYQSQIISFLGLNKTNNIKSGELCDCRNLSSGAYPFLTPREKRKAVNTYKSPTALYGRNGLCIVDGTDFIYDGNVVGQVTTGEKYMAGITTNIVVFPDKKIYSIPDKKWMDIEATYTLDTDVHAVITKTNITISKTNQTDLLTKTFGNFKVGDVVYLTVENNDLKIPETLMVVKSIDSNSSYNENDKITFTTNITPASFSGVGTNTSVDNDGNWVSTVISSGMSMIRKAPNLKYICECNNRIWGCDNTTIYASKLGDPTNFYVYNGLSTDSYAVAVGTDGDFTGCATYGNFVLFFKEDCVHKIYGTKPADFQLITSHMQGVQKGCDKTIFVANDVMFYKGRNGVYAYSGGSPQLISSKLGDCTCDSAVATCDLNRYYICMRKGETSENFVYDIKENVWFKEDNENILDMLYYDGKVYMVTGSGELVQSGGGGYDDMEWNATIVPITEDEHDKKLYGKLNLRVNIGDKAYLNVETSCDNEPFRKVFSSYNVKNKTILIPIMPRRCDVFHIRLSGKGYVEIQSMIREFIKGSDM